METETRTAPAERRHVRVTLEGTACGPVDLPDAKVVRVRLEGNGPLVVIGTDWPGVAIETLQPLRDWSDGDVVARDAFVWTRHGGKWYAVTARGTSCAFDADVDDMLAAGTVQVVRYRHGES